MFLIPKGSGLAERNYFESDKRSKTKHFSSFTKFGWNLFQKECSVDKKHEIGQRGDNEDCSKTAYITYMVIVSLLSNSVLQILQISSKTSSDNVSIQKIYIMEQNIKS